MRTAIVLVMGYYTHPDNLLFGEHKINGVSKESVRRLYSYSDCKIGLEYAYLSSLVGERV